MKLKKSLHCLISSSSLQWESQSVHIADRGLNQLQLPELRTVTQVLYSCMLLTHLLSQ